MRRLAVATFLVAVVVLGLWKLLPFWSAQTPVVDSTPVVSPVSDFGELKLRKGSVACVGDFTLGPNSRYLRFLVSAPRPTRARLAVRADSYRSAGVSTAIGQAPLTFAIRTPSGEITNARACLSVSGPSSVKLLGIPASPLTSDASTSVDGKRSRTNATLTVLEKTGSRRAAALPATLRHAANLSPLPAWMLWFILVLATAGVAAALAYGLAQSAEGLPARNKGDVEQAGTDL